MVTRFAGRLLQGAEVRAIHSALRNQGLAREVYQGVQRGDNLKVMNGIFERAGFQLNKGQLGQFVVERYSTKLSTLYLDKVKQNHGKNSHINLDDIRRIGWTGNLRIILEGKNAAGKTTFRTIIVEDNTATNLNDILEKLLEDYEKFRQMDTDLVTVDRVAAIHHI